MTVTKQTNKVIFTGTATTDIYPYSPTFTIFAATDLVVNEVLIATGVLTPLTLDAVTGGFTVDLDGDGDFDGNITLSDGNLPVTKKLVIQSVLPFKQESDYTSFGPLPAATHEAGLDRVVKICQQLQEQIDRCLKVSVDTEEASTSDTLIDQISTAVTAAELAETNAETAETNAETAEANAAASAVAAAASQATFGVKGADIASAGAMTLGNDGDFFDITGTTNITSIVIWTAGRVVKMQFDGILTVTDGSNLKLHGDFVSAAESTLILVSDGTNWHELSRSILANNIFKSGMQIVWDGAISAIPDGWVICDGNNSTSDMTDRLLLHADADAAGTNDVDDTGGVSTVTLTAAQSGVPVHTHPQDATTLLETAGAKKDGTSFGDVGGTTQENAAASAAEAHTIRDKYHAKAWIMKT